MWSKLRRKGGLEVSGSALRWLLKQGQVAKSGRWEILPPHWDSDPVLRLGQKEREKKTPHDDGVGISIFDF